MINLTNQTVYLITGPARNGKDTLADALALETGLQTAAVSTEIYKQIALELADEVLWKSNHWSVEIGDRMMTAAEREYQRKWLTEQFNTALLAMPKDGDGQKTGLRRHLIAKGNYEANKNPTCWLERLINADVRIIPGVRRIAEFNGIVELIKENGGTPVTIWIERPNREGEKVVDNLELNPSIHDFDMLVMVDEGAHTKIASIAREVAKDRQIAIQASRWPDGDGFEVGTNNIRTTGGRWKNSEIIRL